MHTGREIYKNLQNMVLKQETSETVYFFNVVCMVTITLLYFA